MPERPLRIALLTYSTQPRGSVLHTLELAEALHHLGHSVCIYALDKTGDGFDYPLSCDVKLIAAAAAPSQMEALIQQRIAEFVAQLSDDSLQYDCYHAQDCIGANALAMLVTQQKIPHFVRTVHHIEDYSSLYLQQCQDRSIRAAKLCFCVSEHWQLELQRQYQIQALRVLNGVNLRRFSAPTSAEADLQANLRANLKANLGLQGWPIYLTVGGIEPRKNSLALLRAFHQIRAEYPQAQLVIAGGATLFDYQLYRDAFFDLARQLKLEPSLRLPGVISHAELPLLYRCADAFVFPSLKEGWGLVVLEAIASGLPVITANQAPFTEFLSADQALLVDPLSIDAIAAAMKTAISSQRHALVQESQLVLSQYSWEASAKLHLQYYRQPLP
ncbi:MAG: MSMEG_0565 family glycosyltransferase [Pegethrix bostrychoides GSE-TBD4-15B]|jgi:glycosyltransferase-like protein|uniref:MSMEG_0565 family glycosyltransferase n=1 Tax=Pegethrix bostrychoides GSE-TBD4-15B TaxID=2839662 RepID=A0A951PDD5_9CYAN|nr:MSMEG_0565 family glycosyltransferase [Pegethrix bostrychoides GSE-TBD4-15B]